MKRDLARVAIHTAVAYAILGVLWITASDWVLDSVVKDAALLARLSVYKGWAFIAATALLLYGMLRGELRRWQLEADARQKAELAAAEAQRQAEQRLAELQAASGGLLAAERRASELMKGLPVAVYTTDAEGRFTSHNDAAVAMFGRTPTPEDRWCGAARCFAPDGSLLPPEESPLHHAITTGQGMRGIEVIIERPDGSRAWASAYPAPLHDASGKIIGGMNVLVDITEQRTTERRLATQNAVNAMLARAESLSTAMPAILRAIGESEGWPFGALWELDEPSGQLRCTQLWHANDPAYQPLAQATRQLTLSAGVGVPTLVREKGRAQFFPDLTSPDRFPRAPLIAAAGLSCAVAFPIRMHGEITGVIEFMAREIREPDALQRDLLDSIGAQIGAFIERRRAHEDFERFVSLSPAVIYALRIKGDTFEVFWMTRNLSRVFGSLPEKKERREWWLNRIHPEDRPHVLAAHPLPYEIPHQVLEYRLRRDDGTYFWVRDEKRLVRDSRGAPFEIIGAWTDITERRQLEEQFRQSQKMEAIGTLAGGVAHDFNNLLTVIQGHASLLLTLEGATRDDFMESLTEIHAAADRAAGLTRQLLFFSRRQQSEPSDLDLNATVANLLKMLRRIVGEDIALDAKCDPQLPWVHGDVGMIEQVLMNLTVNARDAMPGGGRIVITTRRATAAEAASIPVAAGVEITEAVCLAVSDSGTGIEPELLPHIFEPFFTTKEPGRGTGLGLATVYSIVKQHRGHVQVASSVGEGTTFRIYLPAIPRSSGEQPPDRCEAVAANGHESILFVEDEAALRGLVASVLERCGYTVYQAGNAADALEIWNARAAEIALLFCDVVLPDGMKGTELGKRLTAEKPSLKVIFTSGYSAALSSRGVTLTPGVNFLQKPFRPLDLASTIRRRLDAA